MQTTFQLDKDPVIPMRNPGQRNRLGVTTVDMYYEYRRRLYKRYGRTKGIKMAIEKNLFVGIVDDYFEKIVKAAVLNRKPFRLRKKLGWIGVMKKKPCKGNKRMYSVRRANINDDNKHRVNYWIKNHYYGDHYFHFHWWRLPNTRQYLRWYMYNPHRYNAKHFLRDHVYELSLDPKRPDYDVEPFNRPLGKLPLNLPL